MSAHIETGKQISEHQLWPYYDKIHRHADRVTGGFILGFFTLGLLLSLFHETYLIALTLGGFSVAVYFIMKQVLPGSAWLRMTGSMVLGIFGLQYLFQMQGLYEMKFMFFISLTVLLFYEDWKVFLPATFYALASLTALFVFRNAAFVTENFQYMQNMSVLSFAIHMILVVFYAALCMWWATIQHNQTRESAIAAIGMEQQLAMVETNIAFADHISHGNLKAAYNADNPDKLGISLINMRESLVEAAGREEREKFANVGLARIADILRLYAENLDMLCDKVIGEVVKYMQANQGSIFVLENRGEENERLRLIASRAWNRKKFLQKTFNKGEGLVGQAAIEQRTIFMTKVPDHYITISSGLGDANPSCILIVPLKSEDVVVGVIELASFKVYQDFEIKFFEKVAESIASTIITTRNNQKNKELLEKSHVLTEQMHAQEEEMRQNLEEMQTTQEEMSRKNKEIERLLQVADQKEQQLQVQLTEIQSFKKESDRKNDEMLSYMKSYRQTLLNILDELPHKIFLKDSEGRMVLVNTLVAKAHHMTIDELIGKSDFDFVDAETATQWRSQELEIIRKGSETYVFNDTIGGKTKTLKSTKMAFFIPHLNELGLLGIQTDITELENLKSQLEDSKKFVS